MALTLLGVCGCVVLDGAGQDSDDGMATTGGVTEGSVSHSTAGEVGGSAADDSTSADASSDGGSDGGGAEDPAPQCDAPGECTCQGCPTSEISTADVLAGSATSWTFSGVVTGADGDGEFFIEGPGGQTFGGVLPTDDAGAFSFETPLFCGEQLVKCVWSNDAGQYAAVTRVITEDCVEADIRVGLAWTELGDDFELHLVRPGGQINTASDCTWTTCVSSSPDWGVQGDASDDPRKDVDNTGAYGPENIFLAGPQDGTYTVLVEHWGGRRSDGAGHGNVQRRR